MRGELFISGRERNLSSVKRRRRIAAHPGISFHDLYRARGSDRSMSCLVSESIIENRVRGEARRKKEKEEEENTGRKEKWLAARDVVWRAPVAGGTPMNTYLSSLQRALSPDHAVPLVLFLLLLLRPFRPFVAHATSSPPACHCTCLPGYLAFLPYTGKREGLAFGESCEGGMTSS